MLVEDVPKSSNTNATTIYFSSSINLSARPTLGKRGAGDGGQSSTQKKNRTKVNYNLNQLFNAQTQTNQASKDTGPLKSAQQIQLEKTVQKRLTELNQETVSKGFELPKNFHYTSIHSSGSGGGGGAGGFLGDSQKSRLGNTPSTKRILAARRNLNSYYEEERNLMSINTILALNYQFVDFIDIDGGPKPGHKRKKLERSRPKIRLCLQQVASRTEILCQASSEKPNDYLKLVQFANMASVGYCVSKGLSPGLLGDPKTKCSLDACSNDMLKDVEIIRIFDFNRMNEVGTGYYAVDKKRKTIILVFRGSASNRDWVTDLNFMPIKYTPIVYNEKFKDGPVYIRSECLGCEVHQGFYQFLKDNSGAVITAGVEMKKKYPDYQFLIIGHSLGGAFTLMSAIEFTLLGYDPLVVTFGGPRVGNQKFADFADKLFDTEDVAARIAKERDFSRGFIRVVHRHDIIPLVPPMYCHAGYEYFIDKRGLPHEECDIDRRGENHSNFFGKRNFNFNFRPSSYWPERLGKFEHTHYFRKITSCKN
ncbi:hypothetical protein KGF56_004080 [Candida oxycetoniae]|uniref:triacylglycerol lipase n=1 Tax=Candida oxycetoniae TaxID=497107 RepID=A0AAI9SUL0_9ASCO|nr:uncharacterized protein KGF56_004080 [Candida oxycetoniae]KAI3403191.2 hypothetical protein KGF56_004080 [Candida oxycetoniae]